MENTTRILNIEDIRTKDSDKATEYAAIDMEIDAIINELINNFPELGYQQLTNIIARYNEIIAEMLIKGHKVNTGLVNLKTSIKDSTILNQSLQNSTVEIKKDSFEKGSYNKINFSTTQRTNSSRSDNTIRLKEKNLLINGETPACGIAFRQWLCKA